MKRLAAPLAICLLAGPLFAQSGTGSITGTLDLDPARWIVASAGEGPTSTWTEADGRVEVRLVGTPDPEGNGGPGTLTIEMQVLAGPVEAQTIDARVELQRTDGTLVAGSENVDLSLNAFQSTGGDLVLAGSIVATLTPEPTGGLVVDPEVGVTIDGNFQATIRD